MPEQLRKTGKIWVLKYIVIAAVVGTLAACAGGSKREGSSQKFLPDCYKITVYPPFRGDIGRCFIENHHFTKGDGIVDPTKQNPGDGDLSVQLARYMRVAKNQRTDREFALMQMQVTGNWGFRVKPPLDRVKDSFGPDPNLQGITAPVTAERRDMPITIQYFVRPRISIAGNLQCIAFDQYFDRIAAANGAMLYRSIIYGTICGVGLDDPTLRQMLENTQF